MNFFDQIRESVIDSKFYLKIRGNSFGRTYSYFVLFFLIVYSMTGVKFYHDYKYIASEIVYSLKKAPDFQLKNGEFTFNAAMPYYVEKSPYSVFVIDTTGKTKAEVLSGVRTGVLMMKNEAILRYKGENTYIKYSSMGALKFDRLSIIELLPSLKPIIIILLAFGFLVSLVLKLLNALLLTLVGLLANSILRAKLSFKELLNFSIYSLTLPLLLSLAVSLSGVILPFFGLVYWIISIMYLVNAIKVYKESNKKDMESEVEI